MMRKMEEMEEMEHHIALRSILSEYEYCLFFYDSLFVYLDDN